MPGNANSDQGVQQTVDVPLRKCGLDGDQEQTERSCCDFRSGATTKPEQDAIALSASLTKTRLFPDAPQPKLVVAGVR
jgi:hypothetical protein